jgi:hypothetical protein
LFAYWWPILRIGMGIQKMEKKENNSTTQKVIIDLERAKSLDPNNSMAHKICGVAYWDMYLNFNQSDVFKNNTCENFTKECQLGDCEMLIEFKEIGVCY